MEIILLMYQFQYHGAAPLGLAVDPCLYTPCRHALLPKAPSPRNRDHLDTVPIPSTGVLMPTSRIATRVAATLAASALLTVGVAGVASAPSLCRS